MIRLVVKDLYIKVEEEDEGVLLALPEPAAELKAIDQGGPDPKSATFAPVASDNLYGEFADFLIFLVQLLDRQELGI